jgi:hypothetical protein
VKRRVTVKTIYYNDFRGYVSRTTESSWNFKEVTLNFWICYKLRQQKTETPPNPYGPSNDVAFDVTVDCRHNTALHVQSRPTIVKPSIDSFHRKRRYSTHPHAKKYQGEALRDKFQAGIRGRWIICRQYRDPDVDGQTASKLAVRTLTGGDATECRNISQGEELRWEVVIYHLIAPIKSKKVRDVG